MPSHHSTHNQHSNTSPNSSQAAGASTADCPQSSDTIEISLQQRALHDLIKRGKAGGLVYPAFWLALSLIYGLYESHAVLFYSNTLLIIGLSIGRSSYIFSRNILLMGIAGF